MAPKSGVILPDVVLRSRESVFTFFIDLCPVPLLELLVILILS